MGFSVPKPKAGINGDVSLDSLAVRDTVALPPLSYSMKVGKDVRGKRGERLYPCEDD